MAYGYYRVDPYNWNSYRSGYGGLAAPASRPDYGGPSKGDIPTRPDTGGTHTMLPIYNVTDVLTADDTELTPEDWYRIHEMVKKASFWGVGGIVTDFLNAADPEKACLQLAIDSIFYLPNVVTKYLFAQQMLQQKRNAKLKSDIKEERADWMQRRKEIAKMFAGSDEKATKFLHQDLIDAKGDINVLAANMAEKNPDALRDAGIEVKKGEYDLNPEQKKRLIWSVLGYRSKEMHGTPPQSHELETYAKQADWFLQNDCYPRMYDDREKERLSEEQKKAEEKYVKDSTRRKGELKEISKSMHRSEEWCKAYIIQDMYEAQGKLDELLKNIQTNTELEPVRLVLEKLMKFHTPEEEGLSEEEKKARQDSEQVYKESVMKDILESDDFAFVHKIAPQLAEQIEKLTGKTNKDGDWEPNQDELGQIGIQLVTAFRFHQAYKTMATGIDLQMINNIVNDHSSSEEGNGAFEMIGGNDILMKQLKDWMKDPTLEEQVRNAATDIKTLTTAQDQIRRAIVYDLNSRMEKQLREMGAFGAKILSVMKLNTQGVTNAINANTQAVENNTQAINNLENTTKESFTAMGEALTSMAARTEEGLQKVEDTVEGARDQIQVDIAAHDQNSTNVIEQATANINGTTEASVNAGVEEVKDHTDDKAKEINENTNETAEKLPETVAKAAVDAAKEVAVEAAVGAGVAAVTGVATNAATTAATAAAVEGVKEFVESVQPPAVPTPPTAEQQPNQADSIQPKNSDQNPGQVREEMGLREVTDALHNFGEVKGLRQEIKGLSDKIDALTKDGRIIVIGQKELDKLLSNTEVPSPTKTNDDQPKGRPPDENEGR